MSNFMLENTYAILLLVLPEDWLHLEYICRQGLRKKETMDYNTQNPFDFTPHTGKQIRFMNFKDFFDRIFNREFDSSIEA